MATGYGIHRVWGYKLKVRYEAEGETALEPRSRRPKTSPAALSAEVVDLIVRVRKQLTDAGLDAGPETIAWHLEHHPGHRVSEVGSLPTEPRPSRSDADHADRYSAGVFHPHRDYQPTGRPPGPSKKK